jgi:hypothetical protein
LLTTNSDLSTYSELRVFSVWAYRMAVHTAGPGRAPRSLPRSGDRPWEAAHARRYRARSVHAPRPRAEPQRRFDRNHAGDPSVRRGLPRVSTAGCTGAHHGTMQPAQPGTPGRIDTCRRSTLRSYQRLNGWGPGRPEGPWLAEDVDGGRSLTPRPGGVRQPRGCRRFVNRSGSHPPPVGRCRDGATASL